MASGLVECWEITQEMPRKSQRREWLSDLGAMCQVSLVGYAVGGAFLSLAYFDLPYNILIMIVVARRWIKRQAWLETEELEASLPRQKRCWQHEHSRHSLSDSPLRRVARN